MEVQGRIKMELIWMATAKLLSQRSSCSKLQVGCIITSNDLRHVLGNGYNGGAKGQHNKCEAIDPCGHIHAEYNALIDCGSAIKDKIMFVTVLPCEMCAKGIVNSGFSKVYYLEDHPKKGSINIFKRAKIKLIKI